MGYHTLDDMVHAGAFENFARGAITGWFSPQTNLKSIPLMWNRSECQRRSKIMEARYGGWRFWSIWWGFVAGFLVFGTVYDEASPKPNHALQTCG